MTANKKTKTDPELIKQIDSVKADNEQIQAVFSLDLPLKKLLDPKQVEDTTHRVLQRAQERAGSQAEDVNIFENLGSFSVSADASVIRQIIDDPDIKTAVANRQTKKTTQK